MSQVALGRNVLVVLLTCRLAGSTQLGTGDAELPLRIGYLVPDLLVLGSAGPLVHAQLLRARGVRRPVPGENLGSLFVVSAPPRAGRRPAGQVLAHPFVPTQC